jgi:hypothetical protein
MRSLIRNPLISHSASRNKRLALTLLMSFCLTYVGQAFATPMVCMMPANEVTKVSASSPCHDMMSESNSNVQSMTATSTKIDVMDCCDSTTSDAGLAMTSHDCACADSGCGASFIFIASFSCGSLSINEQPHYYSTIGFPNQIDSALFRPPIA